MDKFKEVFANFGERIKDIIAKLMEKHADEREMDRLGCRVASRMRRMWVGIPCDMLRASTAAGMFHWTRLGLWTVGGQIGTVKQIIPVF